MQKRQVWITDNSNPKYQKIKSSFVEAMFEQSKQQKINYYDFLLVAKKLCFRFEESSHLMALKNYFSKNKNLVHIKKISDLLCISQQSLHAQQEKIIVKFIVPQTEFAPIKQQTQEDEQNQHLSEQDMKNEIFEQIGSNVSEEEEREINEKMALILSIKVDEMEKKIQALINQKQPINLISLVEEQQNTKFSYEVFKKLIIVLLQKSRERIKISEDDIKTLFFVLDVEKQGQIVSQEIKQIGNLANMSAKLKQFYRARINRDMVKNTLFKLGKVKNNSIQIYQVKNASLLEFESMQKSILEEHEHGKAMVLKQVKIPHFGPLKGAALANKQRQTMPSRITNKVLSPQITFQRERIERILRVSKQEKHKNKKGDTVASKLRSLFIHKVILPREKMLEEQKFRYARNKTIQNDLFVKSSQQK